MLAVLIHVCALGLTCFVSFTAFFAGCTGRPSWIISMHVRMLRCTWAMSWREEEIEKLVRFSLLSSGCIASIVFALLTAAKLLQALRMLT